MAAPILDTAVLDQMVEDLDRETVEMLIDTFVDELAGRLDRMADATDPIDVAVLQREAHALKSSAGTYGLMQLYEIAVELDRVTKRGDAAAAAPLAAQLDDLGDAAVDALTTWQDAG